MAEHLVKFDSAAQPIKVPTGTLLSEAAHQAGVELNQPCGGQGRCGRCAVQVTEGSARRRSTLRLSTTDVALGFALACQTVIEADLSVTIPPQAKIERLLTTDRTVAEITVPEEYNFRLDQTIQRVALSLSPPDLSDQTDDWNRLQSALRQKAHLGEIYISLDMLQNLGTILRKNDWQVTAILDMHSWDCQNCPPRLIDLRPGLEQQSDPLWGIAIDVGTTTITLLLVDLVTGEVRSQVAEYNRQIARGEDVISRIIYASKDDGLSQLKSLVLETINSLLELACKRVKLDSPLNPRDIVKVTVVGNSTMMHLLLGIPAESIRMMPFITAVNQVPSLTAKEVGLNINPEATVDCLPGVASYVGADITAGVLAAGVDETEKITLFLDVGTNGEIVLGSREWLVTCACSAGPAFEGAGVEHGMRATKGAIEEIWINQKTLEPTYRVIGGVKPVGICGSGLISLLAETFLTGIVDKAGNINAGVQIPRIRQGEHGWEYVVAWADESGHGKNIAITHVDINNLLRAKAAIYAGFTVLGQSVGIPLDWVEQILIGGSFGKYINIEKAIEIGLLPDLPWERFQYLGNTAVRGAYLALLSQREREKVKDIASRMTYIELSADNTFYEAFMSALFLPHTDLTRFPTVEAAMSGKEAQ